MALTYNTLSRVEQIAGGKLLYTTGDSAWCSVGDLEGWDGIYIYICMYVHTNMADSFLRNQHIIKQLHSNKKGMLLSLCQSFMFQIFPPYLGLLLTF